MREREGEGEGEVEGKEREGPKLLLNQGPSEPCYATDPHTSTAHCLTETPGNTESMRKILYGSWN